MIERKDVPYRLATRPLPEDEGGGYLIEFPDLPGSMSDGETIEDAITNDIDAMRGWTPALRGEGVSGSRTDPLRGISRWPLVALTEAAR